MRLFLSFLAIAIFTFIIPFGVCEIYQSVTKDVLQILAHSGIHASCIIGAFCALGGIVITALGTIYAVFIHPAIKQRRKKARKN